METISNCHKYHNLIGETHFNVFFLIMYTTVQQIEAIFEKKTQVTWNQLNEFMKYLHGNNIYVLYSVKYP